MNLSNNRSIRHHLGLLSLLLCITVGCYEPTEGCIEAWATNYDVLADDLCDDCCSAPEINAEITYYLNDSTTYSFGDTILHASGLHYSVLSLNMMLVDFEIGSNGVQIEEINDSTEIQDIDYEQDFGFSTRQGGSIPLTEYEDPYTIDSIAFSQGLIPEWQDTTIFGRDNTTVAVAIDSLYIDSLDLFTVMSCYISLDTIDIDTIHLVSSRIDTVRYGYSFSDIQLSLGEDTDIEIQVDLVSWFDNIISQVETSEPNVLADILLDTMEDHINIE